MKLRHECFAACVLLLVVSAWAQSVQPSDDDSRAASCDCSEGQCGCCKYLGWGLVGINGTLCSNATYLESECGIAVTITYNNYTILNETVSVTDPPPICVPIPILEPIRADICVTFYNLGFGDPYLYGCAKATITVSHVISKQVDLGCWNTPGKLRPGAPLNKSSCIAQIAKKEPEQSTHSSNQISDDKTV